MGRAMAKFGAIFATLLPALPSSFAAQVSDQTLRETTAVLRIVRNDVALMNGRSYLQVCEFPTRWALYVVPEWIAVAELSTRLHADLVGPTETSPGPETLLGRKGDILGFCSDEETKKYDAVNMETFIAGQDERMTWDRSNVAFPVFDEHYRKAIVVVSHSTAAVSRDRLR